MGSARSSLDSGEGLGLEQLLGFEKRVGAHGETWPPPSSPPLRLTPWHRGPLTSVLGRALVGEAREGPTGRTLCWPSSASGFPGPPSPWQMGGHGGP